MSIWQQMPFKTAVLLICNIHAWHGHEPHHGMVLKDIGKGKKQEGVFTKCIPNDFCLTSWEHTLFGPSCLSLLILYPRHYLL